VLIPLANHLETAGNGCIGVITSVAGDAAAPQLHLRRAKGALNTYLQGLRTRLYPAGVAITTLKLGRSDTPIRGITRSTRCSAKPHCGSVSIVRALDARQPRLTCLRSGAPRAAREEHAEWLFQRLPSCQGAERRSTRACGRSGICPSCTHSKLANVSARGLTDPDDRRQT